LWGERKKLKKEKGKKRRREKLKKKRGGRKEITRQKRRTAYGKLSAEGRVQRKCGKGKKSKKKKPAQGKREGIG